MGANIMKISPPTLYLLKRRLEEHDIRNKLLLSELLENIDVETAGFLKPEEIPYISTDPLFLKLAVFITRTIL